MEWVTILFGSSSFGGDFALLLARRGYRVAYVDLHGALSVEPVREAAVISGATWDAAPPSLLGEAAARLASRHGASRVYILLPWASCDWRTLAATLPSVFESLRGFKLTVAVSTLTGITSGDGCCSPVHWRGAAECLAVNLCKLHGNCSIVVLPEVACARCSTPLVRFAKGESRPCNCNSEVTLLWWEDAASALLSATEPGVGVAWNEVMRLCEILPSCVECGGECEEPWPVARPPGGILDEAGWRPSVPPLEALGRVLGGQS